MANKAKESDNKSIKDYQKKPKHKKMEPYDRRKNQSLRF